MEILSTLTAIDEKKFYCEKCLSKYSGRADYETMTQKSRDLKGCFGVKPNPIHAIPLSADGSEAIRFSTCIGNFFSGTILSFSEMQRQYEKGVLPFPGSLLQQPNKIIEIFGVISKYKMDRVERDRKAKDAEDRRKRGR